MKSQITLISTIRKKLGISRRTRSEYGILELLYGIYSSLGSRRRRQLVLTIALMLLTSLAEMISLGAVVPFLAVLADPNVLWQTGVVGAISPLLGWQRPTDVIAPICLAFAAAALIAGLIRVLMLWVNIRLASAIGSDLSSEVYRRTLYQPYAVHVDRNSSKTISTTALQVTETVKVIRSLLRLVTASLVFIGLSGTLLAINASVALIATGVVGLGYGVVIITAGQRLKRNSKRIVSAQELLVKALQEGLGAIRDVLLNNSQPIYVDLYRAADRRFRFAEANNAFLSFYPRYALESLGTIVIAGIAWGLTLRGTGLTGALPVLGALALGAQRLLPTFQQIYRSWSIVSGNQTALRVTLDYLQQPLPHDLLSAVGLLRFENELRFEQVSFAYGLDLPYILKDLTLSIRPGMRVGFVGATGSGKSTCLDLLMGLLSPTQGQITVDGVALQGVVVQAWHQQIAHVPQSIYLADASISENIALGLPASQLDVTRLKQAAQEAQIAEFIETLPEEL